MESRLYHSTSTRFHGDHRHEIPVYDPGDRLVDDSAFVPTAESIRRLTSASYGNSAQSSWAYDFRDGKDTGIAVPITRYPGVDPTEVQAYKDSLMQQVKDDVQEQLDNAANNALTDAASSEPSSVPTAQSAPVQA